MMEVFHVAVAVLGLLSLGHSAPVTDCASLIKPLEIQSIEQLLGTWTLLAESTDIPGSKTLIKMIVESAWVQLNATEDNDVVNILQAQKMIGSCFTIRAQMTLVNNTFSVGDVFGSNGMFLTTSCPDCLVITSKNTIGNTTFTNADFLSKRPKVSAAELEEFHKQVECLNLPQAAILKEDLAPCQAESTKTIDLTATFEEFGPQIMKMLAKYLKSQDWMETIINLISPISKA